MDLIVTLSISAVQHNNTRHKHVVSLHWVSLCWMSLSVIVPVSVSQCQLPTTLNISAIQRNNTQHKHLVSWCCIFILWCWMSLCQVSLQRRINYTCKFFMYYNNKLFKCSFTLKVANLGMVWHYNFSLKRNSEILREIISVNLTLIFGYFTLLIKTEPCGAGD